MKGHSRGLGPLENGGRVAVLGGGPAGTATAIALRLSGQQSGRELQVTLIEGKQFTGEQHHNLCTGVLAPPTQALMEEELCVPFPYHLERDLITGIVLHSDRRQIILDSGGDPVEGGMGEPLDNSENSVALRRVQFDAYMLEAVRQRGVEVLPARVTALELHDTHAMVYTESAPVKADAVVGAFGLDEGTAAIFKKAAGYQPPPRMAAVVTKYHPGDPGMERFGHRIHAFLPRTQRIEFGGITPKGNHLTINIAGVHVDSSDLDAFLAYPQVREALPDLDNAGRFDANDLRYFKGFFPRGLARNFSGDRFVLVGDAAGLVRAFKGKGVTSAIQSGIHAANTMLRDGISARAFQAYKEANRPIIDDLFYGQAMRHFAILAARFGLMGVIVAAAQGDAGLRRALYDAVSARNTYRQVLREALTLASVQAVVKEMGRAGRRARGLADKKAKKM